ncbi:Uncharacterised protein [uncultured archaeon]|nr:Uncharacterised protein [uncultured archaeon]
MKKIKACLKVASDYIGAKWLQIKVSFKSAWEGTKAYFFAIPWRIRRSFQKSVVGQWWFRVTHPYRVSQQRWRMWDFGKKSTYLEFTGMDDLYLTSKLVENDSTFEHREILYKAVMSCPYVSAKYKLGYWWRNKVVYRFSVYAEICKNITSVFPKRK